MCQLSLKSFKGFMSYKAEGIQSHMTPKSDLDIEAPSGTWLLHVISMWLTFVSGFFEILQGVQELQSRREIAKYDL
jgi:hypothetical protein